MIEIILKLITLLYNTSTIYEFGRLLPLDVLLGIIFICVFPICVFLYLIKKINDKYHILFSLWHFICHRFGIRMDI